MRLLNHVRATYEGGKEKDVKVIAKGKKVADSIADDLLLDAKGVLKDLENSKGVKTLNYWEDKGEIKKPAKKSSKKADSK